ncbi:nuclear transport factor 2 family protein [Methylobacterium oryzisoli]|uniref:nuclear transport factor 2 family protein n=1 Tax=Methylobacterium oryzisoli TaxID=3385502 RepID=UPI0038919D62
MADAATIAARYLASWNETDPERRRALLAALWTETGTYADPLMRGTGPEEIGRLVAAVQERFPGHRFVLAGRPDGHGEPPRGFVRFSWALGPEGGESLVEGTDVALLDGGRLAQVVGFLDKVPAGA